MSHNLCCNLRSLCKLHMHSSQCNHGQDKGVFCVGLVINYSGQSTEHFQKVLFSQNARYRDYLAVNQLLKY